MGIIFTEMNAGVIAKCVREAIVLPEGVRLDITHMDIVQNTCRFVINLKTQHSQTVDILSFNAASYEYSEEYVLDKFTSRVGELLDKYAPVIPEDFFKNRTIRIERGKNSWEVVDSKEGGGIS